MVWYIPLESKIYPAPSFRRITGTAAKETVARGPPRWSTFANPALIPLDLWERTPRVKVTPLHEAWRHQCKWLPNAPRSTKSGFRPNYLELYRKSSVLILFQTISVNTNKYIILVWRKNYAAILGRAILTLALGKLSWIEELYCNISFWRENYLTFFAY